ncbi:trehalose transporter 1-like protein [Anticarsia gemmatalis]|uniref:trehalose transporter 1-like protein n=1 Tax=Anticarsia gemmatalis TaxID=129554 RepID=UPI003F75FCCE
MNDFDIELKMNQKKNRLKRKYFYRQLLVNSAAIICLFIHGVEVGAPTVLVPQLRQEANSTDAVTPEQASWLPAIASYTAVPGLIVQNAMAAYFGRKVTHTFVSIGALIGFIIFYCSPNIQVIMIAQFFQGVFMSPYVCTVIMFIAEYTSSEHRGLFLTIKSATFFWGILTSNVLGTFFHWKTIPMLGMACSVYSLIVGYFWPESPLWLAKMGRFDQCAKSHRWLKGSSEKSEKELEKLLAENQNSKNKMPLKYQINHTFKSIIKKEIYKPVLLSQLLIALYVFSGKLVYTVYAVEILKKITNKTSTAYAGMLIIDAVTIFSMYIGCAFVKVFKRRTLLFACSSIGVAFLYILSIYLYLVKFHVFAEDKYVSISLLVGFSINKTLQEIAECMKGVKSVEDNRLLPTVRDNVTIVPENQK